MNLHRQQMPLSSSKEGNKSTAYRSASQHDGVGDCGESWHETTARLIRSSWHVCVDAVGEVAKNGADTRQRNTGRRRRAMFSEEGMSKVSKSRKFQRPTFTHVKEIY
jgi:hypothetical protein